MHAQTQHDSSLLARSKTNYINHRTLAFREGSEVADVAEQAGDLASVALQQVLFLFAGDNIGDIGGQEAL